MRIHILKILGLFSNFLQFLDMYVLIWASENICSLMQIIIYLLYYILI